MMKRKNVLNKKIGDSYYDIIYSSFVDSVVCIVEVNNEKGTYHIAECDETFLRIFKPEGTLKELHSAMFFARDKQLDGQKNNYETFTDVKVFQKDKYQSEVSFKLDDEERKYMFRFFRLDDSRLIIAFFEGKEVAQSNTLELEKMDTIQETYLFSMIVDLAKDTCVNPNTTEVSAARQDYMDIKYSEWRIMISNMFKDEDKVLFLRASSPENVINTLEMQNDFHIDLQMMNMQGEFVWSRLRFVRMKNFSRENPRFVYTVRDISEDIARLMKQEGMIKAIEEQNEKLQEADKKKTKFFSNMSHEIRTPINAIIGLNEVILRDCEDEAIRGYAMDIKSASRYLLSLVNDILDYSKIEAGKMELVPVEYSMDNLLKEVCRMVKPKLDVKSLDFELKVDEKVPAILFGDELRISQILINLLTNAVKYTRQGKVCLCVEREDDISGQVALRFSVKDTGIGIKQEDMHILFEEYGRLELLQNRENEGTGLGLSIVQGLLARMNSQLVVESEYGKGSEFSFVLLQKEVSEPSCDGELTDRAGFGEVTSDLSNKKILVVDDTEMNIKIAEALIAPYKVQLDSAQGGREALKMMQTHKYDLVFMDHLMPEMDGVATLNELRKLEAYKDVPVVAMTGNYSVTAKAEYVSLGFNDYLEKPIIPEKLDDIIKTYLG